MPFVPVPLFHKFDAFYMKGLESRPLIWAASRKPTDSNIRISQLDQLKVAIDYPIAEMVQNTSKLMFTGPQLSRNKSHLDYSAITAYSDIYKILLEDYKRHLKHFLKEDKKKKMSDGIMKLAVRWQ